jgi:hypothetical protein
VVARIEHSKIESLVRQYVEAARAHGRATEASEYTKANEAHEVIATVYRELRRIGTDAQLALLPLLEDNDVGVRLWASSHALEFSPSDGERVLSALEKMPRSFVGLSAKITLQQWRQGKLRFP